MSARSAKDFIKDTMADLGYRFWPDGFNIENIPSTVFNKAFHIEVTGTNSNEYGNLCQIRNTNFILRVFVKGFRDVGGMIDTSLDYADDILANITSIPERLSVDGVLNIHSESIDLRPLESNDNAIIIELGLRAQYAMETN